jgi:hypothetical protein
MTTTCPDCDRPLAVENDHRDGCECSDCASVCWREWNAGQCYGERVDWRARCKAAEAALLVAAEPIETLYICNNLEPGWMSPAVTDAIAKASMAIRECLPRMTKAQSR